MHGSSKTEAMASSTLYRQGNYMYTMESTKLYIWLDLTFIVEHSEVYVVLKNVWRTDQAGQELMGDKTLPVPAFI